MSSAIQNFLIASLFLSSMGIAVAQQQAVPLTSGVASSEPNDSLLIVPGDRVTVQFLDAPELSQMHLRVTDAGEIPLLLLGPVKISGLTPDGASQVIAAAYVARNFLRSAHVAVTVEEYNSSEVTIFGYVAGAPGGLPGTNGVTISLSTPKPLLTVLSLAGGLSDRASRHITIQRRDRATMPFKVFIPNELFTPNEPNEALKELNDTKVYPGDTIVVPRAGIVYIMGNVGVPRGVVMNEDGKITLMEALSQSGSPLPAAKLEKVMIFHKANSQYAPIALQVNLGKILHGKQPDIDLKPEDVIWVPFSFGKNILLNASQIAAAAGSATATGIVYTH